MSLCCLRNRPSLGVSQLAPKVGKAVSDKRNSNVSTALANVARMDENKAVSSGAIAAPCAVSVTFCAWRTKSGTPTCRSS